MAHFSICLSTGYHPMSKEWMWCRQGPWRSHMALYVATGSQYEDVLVGHTDRWIGFCSRKRVKLSRQLITLHANRSSALDGIGTWRTVIYGALLVRVRCVAITFFFLRIPCIRRVIVNKNVFMSRSARLCYVQLLKTLLPWTSHHHLVEPLLPVVVSGL
jgi:hypothetical protein